MKEGATNATGIIKKKNALQLPVHEPDFRKHPLPVWSGCICPIDTVKQK